MLFRSIVVELTEANNQVINVKGSIAAIENELDLVDEKTANAKQERETRISRLDGQIQKCREDIEATEDKKQKGEKRLQLLQKLQKEIVSLEASDTSLLESYQLIKAMCQEHELGTINEYDVLSQQYKKDLAALKAEIDGKNISCTVRSSKKVPDGR